MSSTESPSSKGLIWSLFNKLVGEEKVGKKEPESNRAIWIREPPVYECTNCGYEFQIKCLYPVFSPVRLCPRCGKQSDYWLWWPFVALSTTASTTVSITPVPE